MLALPSGIGDDTWTGKWFPGPGGVDKNEVVPYQYTKKELHDDMHGIKMGMPSTNCDDGKMNLELDWLDDPTNYTCYDDRQLYLPRYNVYPVFEADHVPAQYSAQHKCMSSKIFYESDIPTFGTHRPLWAQYGEYKFLPRQRWVHNLEHGAVVMLYHPCANELEVDFLRQLVVGCLYRHIITPYNFLTPERPFALVTWGRKLLMSKVDPDLVEDFIKKSARRGPEQTSKDGQYNYELIHHAVVVSTPGDDVICPNYSNSME
ncbi:tumor protein p53-inducible protein 13 [Holotrichia oblita]|uniref:Tumor protein p53-inducible protein 13 n=2 Tax=Holotrichia oblita TaxID=644536 RepID=A0ACB9T2L0_HOLOL|nr:tumor protein p53-inducible protein 13 [Holotrichia oblita]KAI4461045.1 tumor protein p53-inducible protein 13 [Holotrichia oblita]